MRLLDRYLLRELLVPLGYCLGGFLVFWLAFNLFSDISELQEQRMRGIEIFQYYSLRIPEFVVIILPLALLLALLYTLTNLARHNELTAMRAAGLSMWRLCAPYFTVGLVASISLFALNEFCVPPASELADHIYYRRS